MEKIETNPGMSTFKETNGKYIRIEDYDFTGTVDLSVE